MMETVGVFSVPERAIAAFESVTGLRVTVHDLERSLGLCLPPGRFSHYAGFCRHIKPVGDMDAWCVRFELERLRRHLGALREGRWHVCHAGLVEWVVAACEGDRARWVLFAGVRRPGPALRQAYRDGDSGAHAAMLDRIPERPATVGQEEAERILELLRQLAARLLAWRRAELESAPAALREAEAPRDLRIRNYLQAHFRENVSLASLARHLHLSPGRTAHLVREACGETFCDLLAKFRIRYAAELLRHTDEPVRVVAGRCGYAAAAHFHRVFRRHMALSPGEYRRRRA